LAQDHRQPRLRSAGLERMAFCVEGKFASDKPAHFRSINFATELFCSMARPNEPNNETVRVDVPPPTPGKSPDPNIKSRETVRIQLPVHEPMGKAPLHTPTEPPPPAESAAQDLHLSQFSEPVRPPSFSPPLSASVTPAPESPSSGPKKETARILPMPDPVPSAAGQMKNAPSVGPMPHVVPQNALIAVAREKSATLLSWILLGVSAVILIIQIWTYLS
jgi:hypothetical protein